MYLNIAIQTQHFSLTQAEQALQQHAGDVGAVVAFQGKVRAHDESVALTALHVEHYPGVTEHEIARIAHATASRWPLSACCVIHRVGRLLPGEEIVLVVTAAVHRQAAFAAAEYLMDALKTEAPFWKREEFSDGHSRWVDAKTSDQTAHARWFGQK